MVSHKDKDGWKDIVYHMSQAEYDEHKELATILAWCREGIKELNDNLNWDEAAAKERKSEIEALNKNYQDFIHIYKQSPFTYRTLSQHEELKLQNRDE